MSIIFTSPKGGNGTTVTAASYALLSAHRGQRTVIIDLCGDIPATLGMAEPTGPGINDWLSESYSSHNQSLFSLGHELSENVLVVHRGSQFIVGEPRWAALAECISHSAFTVVVDAGVAVVPPVLAQVVDTVATVVKPCYLTLRRAIALSKPMTAYVIKEDGRALTVNDVKHVLGATDITVVPYSPAIARAVDAGLLPSRVVQLLGDHISTPIPS